MERCSSVQPNSIPAGPPSERPAQAKRVAPADKPLPATLIATESTAEARKEFTAYLIDQVASQKEASTKAFDDSAKRSIDRTSVTNEFSLKMLQMVCPHHVLNSHGLV